MTKTKKPISYAGQVAHALLWQQGYIEPEEAPTETLEHVMDLVTSKSSTLRAYEAWGVPPEEGARRIQAARWQEQEQTM